MSLHANVIVCLYLAQVVAGTGVEFRMERNPDNYFCGHLQCVADFSKSEHDVFTCVEMTIYDITRVNAELKLASVSTFHPDMYVDTTKSSAMSCTSIISKLQANLTIQLRQDIDCLYGVYKCQLNVVTVSGHSEVLTEIVTPEQNHTCSRIADFTSHINTLTEMSNFYISHVINQTAEINKLGNQFDNLTILLMNQTNQLMDHTAQLMEQTRLNALEVQVNTSQMRSNPKVGILQEQVSEGAVFRKLMDHTAQMMEQTSQILTLFQKLDLERTNQMQHHDLVEKRLNALEVQLNSSQELSNSQDDILQEQHSQVPCYRGMKHTKAREKIMLWNRVETVCDTATDCGGWVIIQRRARGDMDFNKPWLDYKNGFGNATTDLWIGLDVMHNLTSQGFNELRIDFTHKGYNYFAKYSNFSVADEQSEYRIAIRGYFGNKENTMYSHDGAYFSAYDRDNTKGSENCAQTLRGGWWYNNRCGNVNLNGLWGVKGSSSMKWDWLTEEITFTEMKVRRH